MAMHIAQKLRNESKIAPKMEAVERALWPEKIQRI